MTARWAYLGPPGTFTEAALASLPGAADAEAVPVTTVGEALDAVRAGDVAMAVVPFENSLEGSVAGTLDDLADPTRERLVIAREALLPVSFALVASAGTSLADVRAVTTIPAAEAQVRAWLRAHLPGVPVLPASSTAEAARAVAGGTSEAQAAVASAFAGEKYGLVPLATGLERESGGATPVTRFVAVTRPAAPPPRTGADRTTVVLFEGEDHPGSLLAMLTEFAVRGINLTRLESRPTGEGLGNYCFALDIDGHVLDAALGEALSALKRICARVLFLGSYPRADGVGVPVRPAMGDADFADAAGWLASIRSGG